MAGVMGDLVQIRSRRVVSIFASLATSLIASLVDLLAVLHTRVVLFPALYCATATIAVIVTALGFGVF